MAKFKTFSRGYYSKPKEVTFTAIQHYQQLGKKILINSDLTAKGDGLFGGEDFFINKNLRKVRVNFMTNFTTVLSYGYPEYLLNLAMYHRLQRVRSTFEGVDYDLMD